MWYHFGYARYYGMGNNACAELQAVLDGLILCKAVENVNIVVECDFSLVIS